MLKLDTIRQTQRTLRDAEANYLDASPDDDTEVLYADVQAAEAAAEAELQHLERMLEYLLERPYVVVFVEGGIVQSASSNVPGLELHVVDYDVQQSDAQADWYEIAQADGPSVRVPIASSLPYEEPSVVVQSVLHETAKREAQ